MSGALVPFEERFADRSLSSQFTGNRWDRQMKWTAERQYALQRIRASEELQACDPESVAVALLDVAFSGLSLSPRLAHAYLIPYGDVCTFSPGYRGLEYLVLRAGTVMSIQTNLVYSQDPQFEVWTDEAGTHLLHREHRGKRDVGDITDAYCLARYRGGGHHVERMMRRQLEAVREAATSRRRGGMVWRGPFKEEMYKKAVVRRGSKHWPMDDGDQMRHAHEVMGRYDAVDFTDEPAPEPQAQELLINEDQHSELHAALVEGGLESKEADRWLQMKAEALGLRSIRDLPARLAAETKGSLTARLAQVRERRQQA